MIFMARLCIFIAEKKVAYFCVFVELFREIFIKRREKKEKFNDNQEKKKKKKSQQTTHDEEDDDNEWNEQN